MLTVSNYHYIRKSFDAPYPSIFGVTPKEFRIQLNKLNKTGSFIHPNQLLENGKSILASREQFYLITFDDGLKEQFDLALPILDEFNIPALFFINSVNHEEKEISLVHKIHLIRSKIDSNLILEYLNEEYSIQLHTDDFIKAYETYIYDNKTDAEVKYLLNFKIHHDILNEIISNLFDMYIFEKGLIEKIYMNKDDLLTLSSRDYLGSHTHNHTPLAKLKDNKLSFELKHSKDYLEKLTNKSINFISYPYGTRDTCDDRVAKFAKNIGYKIGFSSIRGNNIEDKNLLLLNRFDCNDLIGGKNYNNES